MCCFHLFLGNILQRPWSWLSLKAVNFNIKRYQNNVIGWEKESTLYTNALPLQGKADLRELEYPLAGQLSCACQMIKVPPSFDNALLRLFLLPINPDLCLSAAFLMPHSYFPWLIPTKFPSCSSRFWRVTYRIVKALVRNVTNTNPESFM